MEICLLWLRGVKKLKREDITIGLRVIPHSKSYCGNLDGSVDWKCAQSKNQPYLFVSEICSHYIVLESTERSNKGDFFLPEDFEPYIEDNKKNEEINNESRDIKMKKSDLNSSMLFKMRDGDLCALLDDVDNGKMFCNKEDIQLGYSSYCVSINDYDEELSSEGDDYDIVAIKQLDSCVRVVCDVLDENELEEWDWVEEVEKEVEEQKIENVAQNITINITIDSKMDINELMRELSSKMKNIGNY